jgi:hypothetical protein
MDSEHFSNGGKGDRLSGSDKLYFVGLVLAPRFLCLWLAQNFRAELAGSLAGSPGNGSYRRGGVSMLLKMWILSGTAVALWLTPLVALDKKVVWHKSVQGLSLCGAVACAVSAGNVARKLSEQGEIEEIKTRAITADVVDEISVATYVSQQQRQQEAEQILSGKGERSDDVQRLERALALPCDQENAEGSECSEQFSQLAKSGTSNEDVQRAERVLQLRAQGWGKGKIILEVWGLTRGGGAKYKAAEAEYKRIVGEQF